MTEDQRAAFMLTQAVATLVEAIGMHAANMQRQHRGESMAYTDREFTDLIYRNGIDWNGAFSFIQGR